MNPDITFRDAVPDWLKAHKPLIKDRTLHDYQQYINPLLDFFGDMVLNKITIDELRSFQSWRSRTLQGPGPQYSRYRHGAENLRIKNEMNCILKPIMREAGLWAAIEAMKFKHLPVSFVGSGHALTQSEVETLMGIAFSRRRWGTAANCLRLMFNTGCGFGEIRHIRRRDIDLQQNTMCISEDGAKNQARMRLIPLTPEARESIEYILARWERVGGSGPDEFVLPHRKNKKNCDFSRPMLSIQKAWIEIRKVAAPVLGDKIKKFRIYDCRVTAITWVLSSGKVSLLTAERLFGHISIQMQRRYFKPDIEVMREAVSVLGSGSSPKPTIREAAFSQCGNIDEALRKLPRKAIAAVAGLVKASGEIER